MYVYIYIYKQTWRLLDRSGPRADSVKMRNQEEAVLKDNQLSHLTNKKIGGGGQGGGGSSAKLRAAFSFKTSK